MLIELSLPKTKIELSLPTFSYLGDIKEYFKDCLCTVIAHRNAVAAVTLVSTSTDKYYCIYIFAVNDFEEPYYKNIAVLHYDSKYDEACYDEAQHDIIRTFVYNIIDVLFQNGIVTGRD